MSFNVHIKAPLIIEFEPGRTFFRFSVWSEQINQIDIDLNTNLYRAGLVPFTVVSGDYNTKYLTPFVRVQIETQFLGEVNYVGLLLYATLDDFITAYLSAACWSARWWLNMRDRFLFSLKWKKKSNLRQSSTFKCLFPCSTQFELDFV